MYIIGNVADDDANTYIYYTFIIIHSTVHFISVHLSLLMHLYTPRSVRAPSLLSPLSSLLAVSVACPCSQSALATTASPAPLPGRVVVGRWSHSSDHHSIIIGHVTDNIHSTVQIISVHFSLLMHSMLRARSLSSLSSFFTFSGFRSMPLQPISSGYDHKPRPASGTRRRRAPVPF